MRALLATVLTAALSVTALLGHAASAEEQRYDGQLDRDDPRLSEGQYYDELVFDAQAGQSIKFFITMVDWAPWAMLFSESGEMVEHTIGSYSGPGYALGSQWEIPKSGRWRLIVTISAPYTPTPYALTWDVVN